MKPDFIALTGGIGAGKSTAGRYLAKKGYRVEDCDILARKAADNAETVEKVRKLLGEEYVSGGKLNRESIRALIFDRPDLLPAYNEIFFEKIEKALHEIDGDEVVFVEIPLIDAFSFPWKEIWRLESSVEARVKRAAERDGTDENDIKRIMSNQRGKYDATRVIVNEGDVTNLYAEIDRILAETEEITGKKNKTK